jgi:hypothetical protein
MRPQPILARAGTPDAKRQTPEAKSQKPKQKINNQSIETSIVLYVVLLYIVTINHTTYHIIDRLLCTISTN